MYDKIFDVCIIGAGASGLVAAIESSRRGLSSVVVDKNKKPGMKLYATGNGRCNLTNDSWNDTDYYGNEFVEKVYDSIYERTGRRPRKFVIDYFEKLGIKTTAKKGYIYPVAVSKLSSESIARKTNVNCDFIDNGININKYNPSISMADREIDFLCVASFREVKNQKYLLRVYKEVAKKNNNLKLVFLGDGQLKKSCMQEAGEMKDKTVFFMGAVDNVEEYMSKSRILVLPSKSEGNPMVINEAIASGMYVIANEVGGVPNLIQNNITGDLIPLNDFECFKKAMLNRISDFAFLEKARIENQSIYDRYSIRQSANKYIELFFKVSSGE